MGKRIKLIDISPEINPSIAVFPGDQPFERNVSMDFSQGHQHLTLSSITTTLHLGAHTDAPNHYDPQGGGIGARSLDYYFGPCQVIRVKIPRGERIQLRHLSRKKILAPRVLFRTDSFPDPYCWNGDFNSLSTEVVEFLAKKKVLLVGIDTPSIDPAEDKILEAHQAVRRHKLAILEGIVLKGVAEKKYQMIALPLKIKDGDASPVRAVLF